MVLAAPLPVRFVEPAAHAHADESVLDPGRSDFLMLRAKGIPDIRLILRPARLSDGDALQSYVRGRLVFVSPCSSLMKPSAPSMFKSTFLPSKVSTTLRASSFPMCPAPRVSTPLRRFWQLGVPDVAGRRSGLT